jgi:hypothetical protein
MNRLDVELGVPFSSKGHAQYTGDQYRIFGQWCTLFIGDAVRRLQAPTDDPIELFAYP